MALEEVQIGDPHVSAHNQERDAINKLIDQFDALDPIKAYDTYSQVVTDAKNALDASQEAKEAFANVVSNQDTSTSKLIGTRGSYTYTTIRSRMDARSGLLATEWGAKLDGSTDDTEAIQAMLDSSSATGSKVVFPPGVTVSSGLKLNSYAQIEGVSGQTSLFGRPGTAPGGSYLSSCVIVRNPASDLPAVTVNGGGVSIKQIHISGGTSTSTTPVLDVSNGFELFMERVRIIQAKGVGVHFGVLGNATLRRIFVDLCGSVSLPAVLFDSKSGDNNAHNSNTTAVYDMHVERQPGSAMHIAVGDDQNSYVETLRFFNLHCESPVETWSPTPDPSSTEPLIVVGNAAPLELIAPFLYQGGGAPILSHRQSTTGTVASRGLSNLNETKGVRIRGGVMLGSDVKKNYPKAGTKIPDMPHAVVLETGDSFHLEGTDVYNSSVSAVKINSGYGSNVSVSPAKTHPKRTSLTDERVGPVVPQRVHRSSSMLTVPSAVTITSAKQDIMSTTLVAPKEGYVEFRLDLDIDYRTANDLLAFALNVNGTEAAGTAVMQHGSTGRNSLSRTWRVSVPSSLAISVSLKGWLASGTGTNNQVRAASTAILTYETTP